MDYLKDLKTAILMVHLLDSNWDEKIEMYWDLQMELHMESKHSLLTRLYIGLGERPVCYQRDLNHTR